MSSILKALQKLEEETLARSGAPPRIDSEILRNGTAPPRRSAMRGGLLAMALFCCGAGVTYLSLKQPRIPRKSSGGSVTAAVAPSVPPAPAAERETSAPIERIMPETIVAAPAAPTEKPRPTAATPGVAGPGRRGSPTARTTAGSSSATPQPPARKPAAPDKARPSTPTLRVNGIAYQEDADSVAVVNGTPLSRGGMIEGFRILEIRRDRVLFGGDGGRFEIQLGESNR